MIRRQSINDVYREAMSEHAFLLRCEGLKLREIAARMGLSTERARQRIRYFSRRMNWACRDMRDTMRRQRVAALSRDALPRCAYKRCGKQFEPQRSGSRYCCNSCANTQRSLTKNGCIE